MSDHTWELRPSQEEAEGVRRRLEANGWVVYPERIPLTGQSGYYCVRTITHEDGTSSQYTHSVRWNLFDTPLQPITIPCRSDAELLGFLWRHARHPGFGFFEYGDERDVGFVCYCRGEQGYSLALRVSTDVFPKITDQTINVLRQFAS